jgi:hypothetical protein
VKLLGGVLYHGLPWEQWPAVGWAHDGGAWVVPSGREAHATEIVGDELKAPKVNGFANGQATTHQIFTIDGDGEHRWVNHQNIQRKSMLWIPLPGAPTVSIFYIGKI